MNNLDNEFDNIFFKYKLITYPDVISKLINNEDVAPINLEINLTNLCNHNCIWCTYSYLHTNADTLSSQVVLDLINSAHKMGVKSITWTGGGEPTMHKDFLKFIKYAGSFGIRQGLNTNGALLTKEMIEYIGKYFSYIRFSVDAADKETLKKCHQTREIDFENIINNIKSVCKVKRDNNSKVVIGYSFLVDESNLEDFLPAIELAKSIGVDYIQIKPIVNYYSDNAQFSEKSIIWNQLEKNFEKAKEYETKDFKVRILQHKFDNIKKQNENYGRNYGKCVGCKVLASVGADGSVDLCCAFKGVKKWSIGNINYEKFEDIWNNEKMKQLIKNVDIKSCPPMCKADEINRLIYFIENYDANKEFI